MRAPSSRFRRASPLETVARAWPSTGVLGRARRLLKPLFEKALGLGGGGAVASRFPGGEIVRLRPAWRNLSWNPDEYAAFRDAITRGDVVIDAGANAGGYAVLFGQWVGPEGHVYAFEPEPRAFAALADHVTLNGLGARVVPVRAAVAEQSGPARLRLAPASGLSRLTNAAFVESQDLHVTATSIDDFCARSNIRPSFIKIDVEGAELPALRGARKTIASAGPELRVYVEMHPALWPELGVTPDDIVRECEASGLVLERLDGSRERLWDVEGVCLQLRPASVRA
jgi:FkbM family methyltransferase